jgi:hypothetical protein
MSAIFVAPKTSSHGQKAPSTLPIDAFFRRIACAELKAQANVAQSKALEALLQLKLNTMVTVL